MAERSYRLYEQNTYAPTAHLETLRRGFTPLSLLDVTELFGYYKDECESVGVEPTLVEFGQWCSASGPFEGDPPCTLYN